MADLPKAEARESGQAGGGISRVGILPQPLRVFISSPGDVDDERERAREAVQALKRRYFDRAPIVLVMWEDLPLQANCSFQEGIDLILSNDVGIDVAIFILWSRLGTPLGQQILKEDGSGYLSGTERELDLMLAARQASKTRPTILIYVREDETAFDERLRGRQTSEKEQLILQKRRVEKFIAEKLHDQADGHSLKAYHVFDTPAAFSKKLQTHLRTVFDELVGAAPAIEPWDPSRRGPPYMGLETFQPEHAMVFFGRESEVLEAHHALKEQARSGCAFLLLSGSSGVGKSSLARAGVVPAIRENEVDEFVSNWRTVIVTPNELGEDYLAGLVRRLSATDALPGLVRDGESLDDFCRVLRKHPDLTIRLRMHDAFSRKADEPTGRLRLLLVIDQLEEMFASSTVALERRRELLATLETLARSGKVWVVATVRSDFLAQVQEEPALARMIQGRGVLPVLHPELDAIRELIEGPARLAALKFEVRAGKSLAGRIFDEAVKHSEILPLVEFLLRKLFEKRSKAGELLWKVFEDLGGVEGALAGRAEETYAGLSEKARGSLPAVLGRLVTIAQIGDEERVIRQPASALELERLPDGEQLVAAFVEERLFTASRDESTGTAVLTIAHESLLRAWPRARTWRAENSEFLRVRARVEARMHEGSPLLERDPLLELAKYHAATNPAGFTPEQMRFISESSVKAEQDRRHRERIRRGALLAFVALLVAIILGLLSWINQDAIKTQWTWYTKMRPYRVANFDGRALSADQEATLAHGSSFKECAASCPEMVVLDGGRFWMGSPPTEAGRSANEGPQREMSIDKRFAIGRFVVTFDEWDACVAVGGCPQVSDGKFGRGTRPVINVTWKEAKGYVAWLSRMTGRRYRLLSEAEWEYAARAGMATAYPWGYEVGVNNAACKGCGSKWDGVSTAPVGLFKPNRFELFDMTGNVFQWLEDCWQEALKDIPAGGLPSVGEDCPRRACRGGAWYEQAQIVRSADRSGFNADSRLDYIGFRVARSLD